ncbi:DMT family transporter [Salinicola acroporae]|uniref:EamA/RhaT family transporter n=1 Tax=Salinicola acroporae TaxID=1541440 RepID=A0ABT6I3B6_9GAMM|nr:DMT family transporter [Salinicola acroporae]MDH4572148.1 EamA/RhaT family transporter [Salinicola acroporae]
MHPERHDNRRQGVALIVGSVCLLALSDALVKSLGAGPSLWQLLALASSISIPLLAGCLLLRGGWRALLPERPGWVILRSLLLLGMWLLFYASLPLIPLATAAVGVYTTPLFIAVLASAIGEEQLTRGSWAAIGLGFGGVLLVLRPGLGVFSLAMTLPVAAACCYAGAMVLTRRHCARERPLVLALGLNLCFALAGVAGSGLVAMWVDDQALPRGFLSRPWQPLDLAEAALILLYALLMVSVNTGVARAYQIAPSSLVGTFDYAYLPFAAVWGALWFDEVPDAATWLGMTVILISGWLVLRRSGTRPRLAKP